MKIFAVKDMKSQNFLQPSIQRSTPDALRSWEIIANEGDSLISRFPHDFRLFYFGDFDTETGKILLVDPTDMGSAADFKKKPEQQLPLQAVQGV